MPPVRRLTASLLAVLIAVAAVGPARATDETGGTVQLADGSALPPAPEGAMRPSIHGEMLASDPGAPAFVADGGADISAQALAAPDASATIQAAGPGGKLPNGLTKEVFGFLPYWLLDATSLASMRYDLVTTIAYFGIAANADGTLNRTGATWGGWTSSALTDVINAAHARGVKVVPTITFMVWDGNYSGMEHLLTSKTRRTKLVNQIAGIVGNRNADGVNVDFEPVPTSLRNQFSAFIRELKAGLKAKGVGSYLTVDTMAGAASWSTGYDVTALAADGAADALMVMAYDFSWSGSARAGGVSPMVSPYIFDVTDAVDAHLKLIPGRKVIWGVPYYGRVWSTKTRNLNSPTCKTRSICPDAAAGAIGDTWAPRYIDALEAIGQHGRRWDDTGKVPWYRWYNSSRSSWYQGYYDDAASLGAKYGMVNSRGLAGIGIWTLLMDKGRGELWSTIRTKFGHTVSRVAGADRYATAAALSRSTFGRGVPLVVLATGADYPDALVGSPLAAASRGPVLLVGRTTIPPATATELRRLRPGRIIIVGNTTSVRARVLRAARDYTTGSVRRLGGAGRYAVAARVSAALAEPGVATAYVATGADFPDALAGAALAARDRAPILLVRRGAIPAVIADELRRLRPGRIVVLGGPGAVSDRVVTRLGRFTAGSVSRLAGADRYATAAAISRANYPAGGARAYVATGANFPDALAAAAVAAKRKAPVLLVGTDALPTPTARELRRLDPRSVVIAGGTGVVSERVRSAIGGLWR